MKHSHSSDLIGNKPVTSEELAKVLKDLSKFKRISISESQPEAELVTSTPVQHILPEPVVPMSSSVPADTILGTFPLQNGGLELSLVGVDAPG